MNALYIVSLHLLDRFIFSLKWEVRGVKTGWSEGRKVDNDAKRLVETKSERYQAGRSVILKVDGRKSQSWTVVEFLCWG